MDIYLNKNIVQLHFFGDYVIARNKEISYIFNNSIKQIIKCVLQTNNIDEIATMLFRKNKFDDGTPKLIAEKISDYMINNKYGKLLFSELESEDVSSNLSIIGKEKLYFPEKIQIELTNICNLNCPHCYKNANSNTKKYLDFEKLLNLFDFLGENVSTIALTGGEPLLHPKFTDIINYIGHKAKLELNSNGLLIHKLSSKVIKQFKGISITLYGLNNEEYFKNVKNPFGFDEIKKSCYFMKDNNIEFNLSLMLTKDKLNLLEKYVETAIDFGARSIQFGSVNNIGRAKDISFENDWHMTKNDFKIAYREMRKLSKKYSDKIKVLEWGRDGYSPTYNVTDPSNPMQIYRNSSIICGAGTLQWALTENMMFKPCVMFPEAKELVLTFDEWKNYVLGNSTVVWEDFINKFCIYCKSNNELPIDYCDKISFGKI